MQEFKLNLIIRTLLLSAAVIMILFIRPEHCMGSQSLDMIFGYRAEIHHNLNDLPQWPDVKAKHLKKDIAGPPDLAQWFSLMESIQPLSQYEQIKRVNSFANEKNYVLDIDNYGTDDYWAIVKEFLMFNGDCEDYAITKFFTLRRLGMPPDSLRIVILQDNNLGIAHAVLAVKYMEDILIMDNQVSEVLSHKDILHYTPLYSLNEKNWWLHLPLD